MQIRMVQLIGLGLRHFTSATLQATAKSRSAGTRLRGNILLLHIIHAAESW